MKQMPNKPILTATQIAEKFIKPENPFCGSQRQAVKLIRADLVEYINLAIAAGVSKAHSEWVSVPEIPAQY